MMLIPLEYLAAMNNAHTITTIYYYLSLYSAPYYTFLRILMLNVISDCFIFGSENFKNTFSGT